MTSAPPTADHLQAQITAEIMRSRPATEDSNSRMSAADAAVLTLLVTVDLAAWCYAALLGLRALVG